jgi:diketogulonate reductase-like aldo/keto reductase
MNSNIVNHESKIQLNHGGPIPIIGYGTYCHPPKNRILDALPIALKTGYQLIDTAMNYHNEQFIGEILSKAEVSREKLFITTKIWKPAMKLKLVREAVEESLENLNLEYVDLLLIHRPLSEFNVSTWEIMEDLYKEGITKSIGVSNFIIRHLEQLKETSTITPAVNQIELHPFFNRKNLIEYCKNEKIAVESYSPIALGKRLDDKRLFELGNTYSKTPAQILLRWNIQNGCIPIPRSMSKVHIEENFNVFDFEISQAEMDQMNTWNEDFLVISPDPDEPDIR